MTFLFEVKGGEKFTKKSHNLYVSDLVLTETQRNQFRLP